MPPRIPIHPPSKAVSSILRLRKPHSSHRHYATAQATITPAASISQMTSPPPPQRRYPATQPPSFKPPEFRKSQLLRQYASLLRSTPLTLLFQHNNVKSNEWMAIRRELIKALQKTDASLNNGVNIASGVTLQIVQTGIFAAALRIVEFYEPGKQGEELTHVLGETAHSAAAKRTSHALAPLLSGPLVLLTFPTVSPQHLAAALSILSPSPPNFPAPTRRLNPGWHDNSVQTGLQKTLLLGARIEGKVFDVEGIKWVGGIEGGIDGLRAQVVAMLTGAGGANLANVLEGASRSLYFTLEGRKEMLEEEAKGGEAPKAEQT